MEKKEEERVRKEIEILNEREQEGSPKAQKSKEDWRPGQHRQFEQTMSIIGNNPHQQEGEEQVQQENEPVNDPTKVDIPTPVIVAQTEPENIGALIQEPESIAGLIQEPEVITREPVAQP